MRSSNSPLRAPHTNAATAARLSTTTGPAGKRELRSAITPSPTSPSSTQLPVGLLAVLLRHRTGWLLLTDDDCTCRWLCISTCARKADSPPSVCDEDHLDGGERGSNGETAMSYSRGASRSCTAGGSTTVVRALRAEADRPASKPEPAPAADALAPMVELWEKLLAQHVPDEEGYCRSCTKGWNRAGDHAVAMCDPRARCDGPRPPRSGSRQGGFVDRLPPRARAAASENSLRRRGGPPVLRR
jgi:hypothetical protein